MSARTPAVFAASIGLWSLACSTAPPTATPPSAPSKPTVAPTPPGPEPAAESSRSDPPQWVFEGFDVSREGVLALPSKLLFQINTPELLPESEPALETAIRFLRAFPSVTLLRIEAHSDRNGSRARNAELTRERALAVAQALIARGIACSRLLPVGFGGERPIECNTCPDDRIRNRRIELHIALVRGDPAFGPPDGGGTPAGDPCRGP